MRISKDVDPFSREIVAYQPEWHQSTNMPVYLDGRDPPPDDAVHTWGGFSKARWDGDMLRITTTHLKEGYLRRNGLPPLTPRERKSKASLVTRGLCQ